MLEQLAREIRQAARSWRQSPWLGVVAIVTLALGIGANTAIFSVVSALLLQPLPYRQPDRLAVLWESLPKDGRERSRATPANYRSWRDEVRLFDELAAFGAGGVNATGEGDPEQLLGVRVSDNYFRALGVQPVLGRTFLPGEMLPGQDKVVILSHGLWQRRYGRRPDVVGSDVMLDGAPYRVVGVMPPGLYPAWPLTTAHISFSPRHQQLWMPLALSPERWQDRHSHVLGVIGRLKEGVTTDEATAELDVIADRLEAAYPEANRDEEIRMSSLVDEFVGGVRPALLALFAAVALVLFIACANVAGLLLARSAGRRGELALRVALGANRTRLVRHLLVESLLLALAAAPVAVGAAYLGVAWLVTLLPADFPRLSEVALDGRALGFALGLSLLTGVVFGLVPALWSARADLHEALRSGARGVGDRRRRAAASRVLVVGQVSLAVILVVGAGLLVQSFWRLSQVDPGFSARQVLVVEINLPPAKYRTSQQVSAFHRVLVDRLSELPGVDTAAVAYDHPLEAAWLDTFVVEGQADTAAQEPRAAWLRIVGPDYFRVAGIRLVEGRVPSARDDAEHPGVVVVNEAFAHQYLRDANILGTRLRLSSLSAASDERLPQSFEVVGVVGGVRFLGLDREPEPAYYVPAAQFPRHDMSVLVGTDHNPVALLPAVRRTVESIDPMLPVAGTTSLSALLDQALGRPRFNTLLLALFGLKAVLLAALGLFGLLAQSVAQRTPEIGVRLALGARPGQVMRQVVGQGLGLVSVGIALGVAGAAAVTRVLSSALYAVSPLEPATFLAATLFLAAVAVAASYVPARRAARVDPLVALRDH